MRCPSAPVNARLAAEGDDRVTESPTQARSPIPAAGIRLASGPGPELTIVVPTFNEQGNVVALVARLDQVLEGLSWQVIFVDDNSPDGTARVVKDLAATDCRIQCLHRVGRRGLAGAVIEGAMASAAPYIAVIDGDLQHDETLLPQMLLALQQDRADVVIGSRFLTTGDASVLGARREMGSHLANWLGRKVLSVELTDPVSGFFMIRRPLIDAVAHRLSNDGFKVLFDILASQPTPPRCLELPYMFRPRTSGLSKLDNRVVAHYLGMLSSKLSRDILSPKILIFGAVGAGGVAIHLLILQGLLAAQVTFALAQTGAALTAMTSNYLINNSVTYRDRRKRGLGLVTGYLRFCALCSVGLLANVAVASMVNEHVGIWWLAGIAGAGVGAAWNFTTTSVAVW